MTQRPDNRLTEAPMTVVQCLRCTARVTVRKSSWNQTSIQWDASATARCGERGEAERLAAVGGTSLFLTCSALTQAITDAVRRGELAIVEESGSASANAS